MNKQYAKAWEQFCKARNEYRSHLADDMDAQVSALNKFRDRIEELVLIYGDPTQGLPQGVIKG